MTTPASSAGQALARLAKDLSTETCSIHNLRQDRTDSEIWKNELAPQMPPDIVSLRKALNDARDVISDLGFERHSLKSGRLSEPFLARFNGDHAAAVAALPKLIEDAHANHKQAAAASDARSLDRARAVNRLVEGWIDTHREQLHSMHAEFESLYQRYEVELARLHDGVVAVSTWRETSYCGVLLTLTEAFLKILDSDRSLTNAWQTSRLEGKFKQLNHEEWDELDRQIRSETSRLGDMLAALDSQRRTGSPSEPEILDALRDGQALRRLHATLQPFLDASFDTPLGVCARWQGLASWAARFARSQNGREVISFGFLTAQPSRASTAQMQPDGTDDSVAPALLWAEAFRATTRLMLPLVVDEKLDDVVVHRLLQDLDDVIDGKSTELAEDLREVDVLVRTVATRTEHRTAVSSVDADAEVAPLGNPPPYSAALRHGQLPARVLVTLSANGGHLSKRALHRKHRSPSMNDDPRLANLLTPRGELSSQGYIKSEGQMVTLSDAGQMEASAQLSLGTKPLTVDSRSTHGEDTVM